MAPLNSIMGVMPMSTIGQATKISTPGIQPMTNTMPPAIYTTSSPDAMAMMLISLSAGGINPATEEKSILLPHSLEGYLRKSTANPALSARNIFNIKKHTAQLLTEAGVKPGKWTYDNWKDPDVIAFKSDTGDKFRIMLSTGGVVGGPLASYNIVVTTAGGGLFADSFLP